MRLSVDAYLRFLRNAGWHDGICSSSTELFAPRILRQRLTPAEILRRCDGSTSLKAVIADLEANFKEPDLAADVLELVEAGLEHGWLTRR